MSVISRKMPFSRGAAFWEGDATKHFSVKKGVFSAKGGGNSVNEGFGKDFYRKGKSQRRGSGHSLNRRTLKIEKLLSSSPSQKSALSFLEEKTGYAKWRCDTSPSKRVPRRYLRDTL